MLSAEEREEIRFQKLRLRIEVARRIRQARRKRELPQSLVAECAGITQPTLSNYENGKREVPFTTLALLQSILKFELPLPRWVDLPKMPHKRPGFIPVATPDRRGES
jgi:transcriptional regulator with XRE-family HTH domain